MFTINEVFTSIDGEVNRWGQGRLTTFIRFSGCNLRCGYCDTKYAQDKTSGEMITIGQLISKIEAIGCPNLTLTGGEPLLQEGIWDLIRRLGEYQVSIETNGTMPMYYKGQNVCYVADYKLDQADKMDINSMCCLAESDWIKFVITSREDFDQALTIINGVLRPGRCQARMAFSPVMGQDGPNYHTMIDWLYEAGMWDVVVNVQIHKLISVR